MKRLLLLSIALVSTVAHSALSPSAIKLKVYKLAASESLDCSNPITVVDNGSNPSLIDFKGAPNLGSGNLADGNYPCVIIEISDRILVTPSGGAAHCQNGVEFTQDLCGDGGISALISGATTSCGDSTEDRVALYITRGSSATNNLSNPFNPPACSTTGCSTNGVQLGTALTVAGALTGTFKVDADGRVCDGDTGGDCSGTGAQCELLPPLFTFTVN